MRLASVLSYVLPLSHSISPQHCSSSLTNDLEKESFLLPRSQFHCFGIGRNVVDCYVVVHFSSQLSSNQTDRSSEQVVRL